MNCRSIIAMSGFINPIQVRNQIKLDMMETFHLIIYKNDKNNVSILEIFILNLI